MSIHCFPTAIPVTEIDENYKQAEENPLYMEVRKVAEEQLSSPLIGSSQAAQADKEKGPGDPKQEPTNTTDKGRIQAISFSD